MSFVPDLGDHAAETGVQFELTHTDQGDAGGEPPLMARAA